jgi:ribonuclease PH
MFVREGVSFGGKELTIETGRMAKQADGSVVIRYGDTMVLVTAVASTSVRPGIDFMPLTVDYLEKTSAASWSSTRPSRSVRSRTSTSSSRPAATRSSWSRADAPRSARTASSTR